MTNWEKTCINTQKPKPAYPMSLVRTAHLSVLMTVHSFST